MICGIVRGFWFRFLLVLVVCGCLWVVGFLGVGFGVGLRLCWVCGRWVLFRVWVFGMVFVCGFVVGVVC